MSQEDTYQAQRHLLNTLQIGHVLHDKVVAVPHTSNHVQSMASYVYRIKLAKVF